MMRIDPTSFTGHDLVDGLSVKITNSPHFKFTADQITTLRQHCYVLIRNIQNIHDCIEAEPLSNSDVIDDYLTSHDVESEQTTCSCNVKSHVESEQTTCSCNRNSANNQKPCVFNKDKASMKEMALTLCKGHVVSFRESESKTVVRFTKIDEIICNKRTHHESIIFDDGVQLDPDSHELCVNRFYVRSMRETIPNPNPVWDKLTNFLLVPSLYVDDSDKKCDTSSNKTQKKKRKENHRRKSNVGFKHYQYYHRWYRILHSKKIAEKDSIVPTFMRKTRTTRPGDYRRNVRSMNDFYKKTLEYGHGSRFYEVGIAKTLSQEAFDKAKRKLTKSINGYKTKGAVRLNMPVEKPVLYTQLNREDDAHSIRKTIIEENSLKFDHINKTRTIMVCPSCRENPRSAGLRAVVLPPDFSKYSFVRSSVPP